jgi:hypothetical protein
LANIILYHGTTAPDLSPKADGGRDYNDYGKGFYTTKSLDAAKEWACQGDFGSAFVYAYSIETDSFKMLTLDDNAVLEWVSILMAHRISKRIRGAAKERAEQLISHFGIDVTKYDIITGYRANDSYFQFTTDFVTDTITDETLKKSIKLGNLGYQICLRTDAAIKDLKLIDVIKIEGAEYGTFHNSYVLNDHNARDIAENYSREKQSGRLLSDILREIS